MLAMKARLLYIFSFRILIGPDTHPYFFSFFFRNVHLVVSMSIFAARLWFPEHDMQGLPWEVPDNYAQFNPARADLIAKWSTPMMIIHVQTNTHTRTRTHAHAHPRHCFGTHVALSLLVMLSLLAVPFRAVATIASTRRRD